MIHAPIEKTVLENGLTIYSENSPHFNSIALGIWIRTGVIDESALNMGISHFIEHMNFKGTEKRNPFEIANFLESNGGQINAFTSRELTCFYVRILPEHLEQAIDLLNDIIYHSIFPPDEIEKEKLIVLEELRDVWDNPSELAGDLFYETFFGDHPLGYQILGSKETINSFTRNQLIEYREKQYHPGNVVISASGPVEHQRLIDLIYHYFQPSMTSRPQTDSISTFSFTHQAKSYLINTKLSQIHLCMGCPVMSYHDANKWELILFNTLLGSGMSSILFQEIREKLGIAYSITSFIDFYQHIGIWAIYWSTEHKKLKPSFEKVQTLINSLGKEYPITQNQLDSAKNQLKSSLLMSQESVSNRMNRLAKNHIYYGRIIPIEEIIGHIDAINLEHLLHITQRLIIDKPMTITAVGHFKKIPDYLPEVTMQKMDSIIH